MSMKEALEKSTEKTQSVFNYVRRADLSDEELGSLIGLLISQRVVDAVMSGLGDLGVD
jgi:hypothetical protein